MKFTQSPKNSKIEQYKITKVYDIETAIENKRNSLLKNKLYYHFFGLLSFYFNETQNHKLIVTPTELAIGLNYINSKFKSLKSNDTAKKKLGKEIEEEILKEKPSRKPFYNSTKQDIKSLKKKEEEINKKKSKDEEKTILISALVGEEIEDTFIHIPSNYDYKIKSILSDLNKEGVIILKSSKVGIKLVSKDTNEVVVFDENLTNEKISKELKINLATIQQELENGNILQQDLNYMYAQSISGNYYYESQVLTEEEESKYLTITNQLANELGFKSPFDASKSWDSKKYYDKLTIRLRKELNYLFVYNAHKIIFGPETLELQQNFYKDKIYLGQNINKSLTSANKEFYLKAIENKEKRMENTKRDIKWTEDDGKAELETYKKILDKLVLNSVVDDMGLGEPTLTNWKTISKNSDRRIKSEGIF